MKESTDKTSLKYCGYDRSCDLHPFCKKLTSHGNILAQKLLDQCEFLVDIFHCNKHTEPTCFPPNNPNCVYHPHRPKFKPISKVNTECAEQVFFWLSKFKSMVRKMCRWKFRFFLYVIIENHNRLVEQRLLDSGKMTKF